MLTSQSRKSLVNYPSWFWLGETVFPIVMALLAGLIASLILLEVIAVPASWGIVYSAVGYINELELFAAFAVVSLATASAASLVAIGSLMLRNVLLYPLVKAIADKRDSLIERKEMSAEVNEVSSSQQMQVYKDLFEKEQQRTDGLREKLLVAEKKLSFYEGKQLARTPIAPSAERIEGESVREDTAANLSTYPTI